MIWVVVADDAFLLGAYVGSQRSFVRCVASLHGHKQGQRQNWQPPACASWFGQILAPFGGAQQEHVSRTHSSNKARLRMVAAQTRTGTPTERQAAICCKRCESELVVGEPGTGHARQGKHFADSGASTWSLWMRPCQREIAAPFRLLLQLYCVSRAAVNQRKRVARK